MPGCTQFTNSEDFGSISHHSTVALPLPGIEEIPGIDPRGPAVQPKLIGDDCPEHSASPHPPWGDADHREGAARPGAGTAPVRAWPDPGRTDIRTPHRLARWRHLLLAP
ncbi:phosphoglycerate mutase [Pseudarthrobacter siccitolerans]|uniref:Phosphoglycerate mutase n=1 Tax=Pseudarthrobacter siccitolerans TaxID=861266 RepID=A0A024H3C8_9MICC|nr:phosphoglycerate mutase [Pseudarthrobacter siccitolerans]